MTEPRRLSCEETFRRLDDYLDRALSPEEIRLVEEHLETCAVCTSEYRFEGSLLTELRAKLRRLQVPPDLMERISRSIRSAEDGSSDV